MGVRKDFLGLFGRRRPEAVAVAVETVARDPLPEHAVDPRVLAAYWCRALVDLNFGSLARQEPERRIGIEETMGLEAPGFDPAGRQENASDAILCIGIRPAGWKSWKGRGRGELLMAVPAVWVQSGAEEGKGGFRPMAGTVPFFNPDYLGPRGDQFHLGDGEAVRKRLAEALGFEMEEGSGGGADPASAALWSDWLRQSVKCLLECAESAAGGEAAARSGNDDPGVLLARAVERLQGGEAGSLESFAVHFKESISGGAVAEIRSLYQGVMEFWDRIEGDLAVFCRMARTGAAEEARTVDWALGARVTGNMDQHEAGSPERGVFSLDATQALAVRSAMGLEEGDMLAVNGPPGTGKTSMLRAVVASVWVNGAVDAVRSGGGDCPIIVAAGATNQSVTNVIGAFGEAPHRDGSFALGERWLPGVKSYGAYFPSKTILGNPERMKKLSGFICVQPVDRDDADKGRFPYGYYAEPGVADRMDVLDPAHLSDAEEHYLDCFEQCTGARPKGVGEAAKVAGQRLLEIVDDRVGATVNALRERQDEDLRRLLEERRELWTEPRVELIEAFLEKVKGGLAGMDPAEEFSLVQGVLDVSWRAEAFYWAAHYWEARFLGESREWILSRHPRNVEDMLRRMCMVTPCLVATLHSLPRLTRLDKRAQAAGDPRTHLFGVHDLLIIDEAGQASPELAGALLTQAKRAMLVGDVKQLAPIWAWDGVTESVVAREAGALECLPSIRATGRSSATGSALAMARQATRFTDALEEPGVTLRYHYRCARSIIDYCNRLCYGGNLKLVIKDSSNQRLTHMCWFEVEGKPEKLRGSRCNRAEAVEIAKWIHAEWPRWRDEEYKGKTIQEIVAVLSPYRAQEELLRESIAEAFRVKGDGGAWPSEDDLKSITVGTVHKLQGAERPVVCLSVVESPEDVDRSFVDGEDALMNVAVSRAKKLFVVFANPQRLFVGGEHGGRKVPIGFLGDYLKDERYGFRPLAKLS